MAWVRSAGLRGVRTVLERLGADADHYAHRFAVPDGGLDDDELLVRDSTIAALLETAAGELGCPDFGLQVAAEQDLDLLGPLTVALQNAPTVAEAIGYISKYLFLHAPNLGVHLVPDPRGARGVIGVRYGYPDGVLAPPQSIDMGLLFVHRFLNSTFGGNYGLRTVELPHQPAAAVERYEAAFGTRVDFGRPAALLRVPHSFTELPIEGNDRFTRQVALAYLDAQASSADSRITGRAKAVLRQGLGTRPTSVDAVAAMLAMSSRTLQRHLRDEGTSFTTILDDARRERAEALLRRSDLPLGQIATAVGLTNPATLSRHARRWWGTTARAVRNAPRQAGPQLG
ncbi:AraC family transcriptional regulator ligand-binding domain-containing protein [Nocardia sp. NPDC056952]|uniref:AraC family transcriptional regulator n=1 Tax=Nocardia sp. NPDC056952 TaxID=3345979 RepID=UPI003638EDBE